MLSLHSRPDKSRHHKNSLKKPKSRYKILSKFIKVHVINLTLKVRLQDSQGRVDQSLNLWSYLLQMSQDRRILMWLKLEFEF